MTQYMLNVYDRMNLNFVRGQGAYLFDDAGQKYLDFVCGIAVMAFGHGHPAIVQALTEQANKLWLVSNLYRSDMGEAVAKRLCDISFARKVFFQNSGVEAWELGCKMVRKYFKQNGQPQKWRIITLQGAFHGRTMAAIAAAKTEKMIKGFEPIMDGFDQVAFGNLNELKAAIGPETAAIHLEPIQGEGGGIRVAAQDYLQAIRALCDEYGLLLYFDEIQCGMGRTGKMFAYEHTGVVPDIMSLAKGIGAGFPVGACLATQAVGEAMTIGSHGSTYGGNPLALAVVNAALDLYTAPDFLPHVNRMGAYLRGQMEKLVLEYPGVFAEVRGLGLMLGLKLQPAFEALKVAKTLATEEKLLVPYAGENVIRCLPPLVITQIEADEAMACLRRWAARQKV